MTVAEINCEQNRMIAAYLETHSPETLDRWHQAEQQAMSLALARQSTAIGLEHAVDEAITLSVPMRDQVVALQRSLIREALRGRSIRRAAVLLGIKRTSLHTKMNLFGITRES